MPSGQVKRRVVLVEDAESIASSDVQVVESVSPVIG